MAWITKHGKKWRLVYREGGKQRTESFDTKRDANVALAARKEREREDKAARLKSVMTWDGVVRSYLNGNKDSKYVDNYARKLELAAERQGPWEYPIDVNAVDIKALPLGQARLIRAVLKHAAEMGQKVDGMALMAKPQRSQPKRLQKPLVQDSQVQKALELAATWGEHSHLGVHLVATYGHRPATICALTIDALKGDYLTLDIKGGSTHRHPVLDETKVLWKAAAGTRATSEPIMLNHLDRPWKNSTGWSSWYYHKVGEKIHPDDPGIYALQALGHHPHACQGPRPQNGCQHHRTRYTFHPFRHVRTYK